MLGHRLSEIHGLPALDTFTKSLYDLPLWTTIWQRVKANKYRGKYRVNHRELPSKIKEQKEASFSGRTQ